MAREREGAGLEEVEEHKIIILTWPGGREGREDVCLSRIRTPPMVESSLRVVVVVMRPGGGEGRAGVTQLPGRESGRRTNTEVKAEW